MKKRCANCATERPVSDFAIRRSAKDGRQSYCRPCARERKLAWAAANTDRRREYAQRWTAQNPEKNRAATLAWRERNAERVRAVKAEWQRRNAASLREQARERRAADPGRRRRELATWKAANPERVREYQRKRRAKGYGNRLGVVDLAKLLRTSDGACGICGSGLQPSAAWPDPGSTSVDHIVPLSLGGPHEMGNLQLAHLGCNLRKGNRSA